DTLWQFIGDVASGLAYLHKMDVVHHDIKPDNILRTESGSFAITDFGISTKMRSTLRRNSSRSVQQNSSGGSLPYMGPEMFSERAESVKATDIWAFGVTLYEMIT
ncbi:MAG: protein kinase, partial [Bacteroidales bacterium]|nr:protein kinase [Bacteroidales bacterium]